LASRLLTIRRPFSCGHQGGKHYVQREKDQIWDPGSGATQLRGEPAQVGNRAGQNFYAVSRETASVNSHCMPAWTIQ
jgi:hypothetical protein